MTTMTCPAADQLKAFYLGQLSDDQSDVFVSHVSECPTCQAELETVIDLDDSLIANLRASDDGMELDHEPACEVGILKSLGALAIANETPNKREERNENDDSTLPKTIGEYEVLRTLGTGGMGRVYLARHSKLGRLVALKILAGHRLGDRRAIQRFEAEMRVIGRLSHPNIVIAHDARDIDGTAVLVTEYIDGLDLGQLLSRTGPLAIADACEIIRQVAEALQYTSEQGFVHRDVKPSNIMVSNLGEVKLLDLGLARLQYGDPESAEITGTGQTMGTADYISPEQITDSRNVDVRSDIYSLGATLFKLLAGRAPFSDEHHATAFAKMTAHVSTPSTNLRSIRSEIPHELDRLVAAMLSKRPEDRPQRPAFIMEELSRFQGGSNLEALVQNAVTLAAIPHPFQTRSSVESKPQTESFWQRPIKRYQAIAAGFFGALLGLALGIIITITHRDGSKTIITTPDDSKVEIANSEKSGALTGQVLQSNPVAGEGASTNKVAAPLQFAFLVNREATGREPFIRDSDLNAMLEQLPRTNSNAVIRSDHTKFVRIAEDSSDSIPITGWNNGYKYALVSTDPKFSIGWDAIVGRILQSESTTNPTTKEGTLSLKLDEKLGKKMRGVSAAGIGLQLAIIVDDVIVQTPRVNSEIGEAVQINGIFSPQQLQNMRQYLNVSQSASTNPITTTVTTATDVLVVNHDDDVDFGLAYTAFAESLRFRVDSPNGVELPSELELDFFAKKLAHATRWGKEVVPSAKRAITKTWPFKSIQGMSMGGQVGPVWLYTKSEKPYQLNISKRDLLADVRSFVDGWGDRKGLFDEMKMGMEKDLGGPQINLERDLVPHLGEKIIFFTPSKMIAFELSNWPAVEEKIKVWSSLGDGNPKLIGNYLLFGPKQALDDAAKRFEASTTKP